MNRSFACSKFTYGSFQKANNKGADQTAWMRRLACACVVRNPEDRFSRDEAHYFIYCDLNRLLATFANSLVLVWLDIMILDLNYL